MTFQILSLSGGGYRGLYTITVLNELEQHFKKPILSCFDLIAGTSVGGIVALGLAAGHSSLKIKELFEKNGGRVFSNQPAPEVIVEAVSGDNQTKRWTGRNGIGPIPKNCQLTFRVENLSSFPPYSIVEWTVRNEGDEAENLNDLGHRAGIGPSPNERSAYKGRHFMDCVVKQHGLVIGRRRVPVEIAGLPVPRRNPPKPAYVKLKGRR